MFLLNVMVVQRDFVQTVSKCSALLWRYEFTKLLHVLRYIGERH